MRMRKLKVEKPDEIEKARTGRDPESLQWPRDMPVRYSTIRGRASKVPIGQRVIRGLRESRPRKRPCPVCGKDALAEDLATELFYADDYQRVFASWIGSRVVHCPDHGDRWHFETVWIQKPNGWDEIVWPDAHGDEPAVEIAHAPEMDPDDEVEA